MFIVLIIFRRTIPGWKWTDGEAVIVHPSCAPRLSTSVYLADVARRVLREYEHGERPPMSSWILCSTHVPVSEQAWEGDYQPLINCFVESIKASLADVERIMA